MVFVNQLYGHVGNNTPVYIDITSGLLICTCYAIYILYGIEMYTKVQENETAWVQINIGKAKTYVN